MIDLRFLTDLQIIKVLKELKSEEHNGSEEDIKYTPIFTQELFDRGYNDLLLQTAGCIMSTHVRPTIN